MINSSLLVTTNVHIQEESDSIEGKISLTVTTCSFQIHFKWHCRPIYLLNLEYKLAAKCIATWIKAHLSNLINADQTGFIKDCYIGENINKILNIMDIVHEKDLQSVIIRIDFLEKAFDSYEWSFVQRTLNVFNFGPSIIKIFYKDSNSCVLNNGWAS